MFNGIRYRLKVGRTTAKVLGFDFYEFKTFVNATNYSVLHATWVESGFQRKLTPCVDRIRERGDYTLDNIQIITISQNSVKYLKFLKETRTV